MPYKTILVSLNDVAQAGTLIDVASQLTQKNEAHIIGHYVVPAVTVYPEVGMALMPSVFEGYQIYFKSRLAAVKQIFEERMRRDGFTGEWREVESAYPDIASSLVDHALTTDLIIASQVESESQSEIETDLVVRILMESGRPVLVIPRNWQPRPLGELIVCGFNGTKEAARSLFDAMPLLREAREVRLVWVDPYRQRLISGDIPGAEAATALSRHGVKAIAEPMMADGRNAGEALLMRAHDLGADLLIMGAYAHSRMQQYVFGGATNYVLENMTVPVLMSH